MSSVNVRNCIRFYQTAEELNATTLMNYCGEIIASHWVSTFSVCLRLTGLRCFHMLVKWMNSWDCFSGMYYQTILD